MKQFTREQAVRLAKTKFWEELTHDQIARFQLFQRCLCMPFSVFHKSVEKVLKRPVWSHEFASTDALSKEYLGEKEPPTFDEIVALLPQDKVIVVFKPTPPETENS